MEPLVKNIMDGNIEPLSDFHLQLNSGFKRFKTPAKTIDIMAMKYYPASFPIFTILIGEKIRSIMAVKYPPHPFNFHSILERRFKIPWPQNIVLNLLSNSIGEAG